MQDEYPLYLNTRNYIVDYERPDLCSTCDNASKCINKGLSDSPVINHKTSKSVNTASLKTKETERDQGLCLNCTNRETCNFSIPPGGVWHCEEYK